LGSGARLPIGFEIQWHERHKRPQITQARSELARAALRTRLAPAGASAGFTDKKWRTAAAPYDGADGAPATRRPRAPRCSRQADVRSQTNAGAHRPRGDGGPGGVAGSRRARMPQAGGNRPARAHEFGAAHARSTGCSAAQRWTGAHGLEPRTAEKNRSNLVAPCHDKHSGSPRKGEIT